MTHVENVEQLENSYFVVGNVKWFNHYRKAVQEFLIKLNIHLPHNPET